MITKEDLGKKLRELLEGVTPGDLQAVSQKMSEHLKFSIDNYDDLSPEAKKITDDMIEEIKNVTGDAVEKMPESKEKRKLKRLHASSIGKHHRVEQFVQILESPPQLKEDSSKKFKSIFIKRLQNILDFIFDIYQNTLSGFANFGQFSLLCMCVDELLVTFHLAQHYYINQAYSHIRTVFEHLDKVELFRIKPEWAEVWCGSDEERIRKQLSPAGVREKLGKERYDPIYSFFSILGPHGTFKAVQTKTAKRVDPSPKGNPQITMWFGGSPFEHNIVWLNGFALYAIYMVILQIMRSFKKFLNEDECEEILKQVFEESIGYLKEDFLSWAKSNNLNVTEFEDFLNSRSWDKIERGEK